MYLIGCVWGECRRPAVGLAGNHLRLAGGVPVVGSCLADTFFTSYFAPYFSARP